MGVSMDLDYLRLCTLMGSLLVIITDRVRESFGNDPEWEKNEDVRLNPESIAKVLSSSLSLPASSSY